MNTTYNLPVRILMALLGLINFISVSFAQHPSPPKLKIYLDCTYGCDEDYIKTDLSFIDLVRDRIAADVHVQVTSQQNGNGGSRIQLIFFGQHKYQDQNDSLLYNQPANATSVEIRFELTKNIRIGLIPFITGISNARLIEITKGISSEMDLGSSIHRSEGRRTRTKDNWNYWVYKIAADGTFNTDQNYQSNSLSSSLSANRTTDILKVNFSASINHNKTIYSYQNNNITSTYRVLNESFSLGHYFIVSISKHWSLGYDLNFSNNTFLNNKRSESAGAGIEYAIFPYSEVNTRFFAINYTLELRNNVYYDSTIFDKKLEKLWAHKVEGKFSLKEKWGDVNAGIVYSNYFKDWSLNKISLNLSVNVRISGGLSFYIYSYGDLIHDQIYLVKGNATLQEVFTRRRQLASSYSFNSGAGLSYRFGSILNNFVNPRFSTN